MAGLLIERVDVRFISQVTQIFMVTRFGESRESFLGITIGLALGGSKASVFVIILQL